VHFNGGANNSQLHTQNCDGGGGGDKIKLRRRRRENKILEEEIEGVVRKLGYC